MQEWRIEDAELEAMARLWAHPSDLTLLNRVGVILTGDEIDSDGDYFPAGPDVNPQLQAVSVATEDLPNRPGALDVYVGNWN